MSPRDFLHHFFVRVAERTHVQFVRYFVVAAVSVAADFAVFFTLTESFGVHYLAAAAAAFAVWLVINYALSVAWVFPRRRTWGRLLEFALFVAASGLGFLFNISVLWLCTDVLGVFYAWSKIVATGATFFFNFFARKFLLAYRVTV